MRFSMGVFSMGHANCMPHALVEKYCIRTYIINQSVVKYFANRHTNMLIYLNRLSNLGTVANSWHMFVVINDLCKRLQL